VDGLVVAFASLLATLAAVAAGLGPALRVSSVNVVDALRDRAQGASLTPTVRAVIARIDPDVPLQEVFTVREAAYRDKRVLDVLSSLFLVFGIGALSLTAIGLYGVVSFGVASRTREFGVRLALGATRRELVRLVLAQSVGQLAVGLGVGLALGIALSRAFAAAVEAIMPPDVPVLVVIVTSVSLTALAALAVPARRAASLDPADALRRE
jgi:ABC-type antimicrobial peptide transport system permease subunit